MPDENSRRTRVEPICGWLRDHGGPDWPNRFLELVDGLTATVTVGPVVKLEFERRIPPSTARLAWMIRNAERLAPRDGRLWREYQRRVIGNPRRGDALERLDRGERAGIDRLLVLEGKTAADGLVECERAVIWIEGKRNDWLEYSTKWDVTRDQLARNVEAAWLHSSSLGKDFVLVICHESLKHHEELLIDGYRGGTWSGGWPHIDIANRRMLGERIGTITWKQIGEEWPPTGELLK